MNKPAPKEPSMDEILSSIRQIIADDDAAGAGRKPSSQPVAAPPMQAAPVQRAPAPASPANAPSGGLADVLNEIEPLALSASQIVADAPAPANAGGGLSFDDILADTAAEEAAPAAFAEAGLVDADDVTFEPDEGFGEEPADALDETAEFAAAFAEDPEPEPVRVEPQKPAPVASLPDPTLSADLADKLLEPATNAAVRGAFSRLGALALGTQGLTIEAMVREMLRPMLKEWLDENLPSVVERMVEKEIARISRGE